MSPGCPATSTCTTSGCVGVFLRRSARQTERAGSHGRRPPEAIRRVDVSLPAGQLGKSGAVLVDTPGLYARMRFGYDRMTREFRNAAACAIAR